MQSTHIFKDAINAYIVDTLDEDTEFHRVIHGSSLESINNIINNGPDMRQTTTTTTTNAFGPGMYFAFSEGDAHDYSSAKLMADVIPKRKRRERQNCKVQHKFLRQNK